MSFTELCWKIFLVFGLIDIIISIIGTALSSILIHKNTRPYLWIILLLSFLLPIGAFLFFIWMTAVTPEPTDDNVRVTYTIVAASIVVSVILQITAIIMRGIPRSDRDTLRFVAMIFVAAGIASGSMSIFGFMVSRHVIFFLDR